MGRKLLFTGLGCFLVAGLYGAGEVTFKATDVTAVEAGQVSVKILIDNNSTNVYGWSYGICHDPEYLSVAATETGEDTASLKEGNGPDYDLVNICDGGIGRGVIIDLGISVALPVATDWHDFTVTYRNRLPVRCKFHL